MRPVCFINIIAAGLLCACCMLVWSCGEPTVDDIVGSAPVSSVAGDTEKLLVIMNEARQQHGRGALTVDRRLVYAARDHSQSMAKHRYFGHRGKDGFYFQHRMARYSYMPSHSGENLAMARSPETVFRLWYHSEGHKKTMLNKDYQRVGIFRAGKYWTAVFSAPDGT